VAGASKLLGTPVSAVVPLQRHHPGLVLAASAAELAAFVGLLVSGSLAMLIALIALSALLVGVGLTNTRAVLAVSAMGDVVLTASLSGWPTGVSRTTKNKVALPAPAGLGVKVELDGTSWWVDRSWFGLLRTARSIEATNADGV
jgi:hypothetical protein